VLPVLSTSDAVGKVTPCGCSTPKGGLARIASVIDSTKIKYGDALVVDAGDFAPEALGAADDARIEFQVKSLARLGYDAIGVGERELAFGVDRIKTLAAAAKLPLLSANVIDVRSGKPAFQPWAVIPKGSLRVGVFAVLGPRIDLPSKVRTTLRVEDPILASLRAIAALRAEHCDVIVALAHVGLAEGNDLASQVPGLDVVVFAHHAGVVTNGENPGVITIASGEQIESLGVTRLTLDGRRVKSASSESLALLPEVGERGDIARLVKDFEASQEKPAIRK